MESSAEAIKSSRIFVRGLPPNITEADLKKHFSGNKGEVTDIKIIPQRRIGYVGFKNSEQAEDAVRYFNRSYLRMSKLGVELAKPINDPSLKKSFNRNPILSTKQQNVSVLDQPARKETHQVTDTKKRKREQEVDAAASNPKLREFLNVMQTSKGGLEIPDFDVATVPQPPAKNIFPEDASDDEYEEIPSRPLKRQTTDPPQTVGAPAATTNAAPEAVTEKAPEPMDVDESNEVEAAAPVAATAVTDDDWLRSRTSRMLDLIDEEDIKPLAPSPQVAPVLKSTTQTENPTTTDATEETITPKGEPVAQPKKKTTLSEQEQHIQTIRQTCRLFVRNLSYKTREDDIRTLFEQFGAVEEVHIPTTAAGKSKGFALVLFADAETAVAAFQKSDGVSFQGRLLHLLPAAAKREGELDEFTLAKLPLKQQNLIRKRAEAASNTFNWNSLYMNQDAVVSSMAQRLGVSKAELLDPTSSDAAVKKAIAETTIIQETKSYFTANGVNLDAFKQQKRGDTAILVKNFPFNTTIEEIRNMFAEHGTVVRVLMPPNGTIAIVQMASPPHAKTAFARLAYRRVKDSVLFLEKAPANIFNDDHVTVTPTVEPVQDLKPGVQKLSVSQLLTETAEETEEVSVDTTSLFVGNLNFVTTTEGLAAAFQSQDGFVSARVKTKHDPKKPGKVLSMGFGFVEFRSKDQAHAALKAMQNYNLDGHALNLKASHRGLDAAEERRREEKAKKAAGQRTKIVIKNLPFEASKKDIRTLFSTYGQLRSVRVPKKFNHTSRGFAFAEFVTAKEAENALNALRDTHLLGRKLVLDFAEAEAVDAEEEIDKMSRKIGSQVNKVTLQQLTNRDRARVTIGEEGVDE
ncbi:hypothetical protein TD95_004075 [Thielaviopsis punctulata]|uniref:Multiple RNA-binding domain-containing protein 1 n=1 Tax=Thielaviopsis punctulata TaxID=72032 RepID=A0A0F4ZCB8_9PEZI|nr:hypothetical protein TD95_004075 [Thielaviopsis punctulata]